MLWYCAAGQCWDVSAAHSDIMVLWELSGQPWRLTYRYRVPISRVAFAASLDAERMGMGERDQEGVQVPLRPGS